MHFLIPLQYLVRIARARVCVSIYQYPNICFRQYAVFMNIIVSLSRLNSDSKIEITPNYAPKIIL